MHSPNTALNPRPALQNVLPFLTDLQATFWVTRSPTVIGHQTPSAGRLIKLFVGKVCTLPAFLPPNFYVQYLYQE